MTTYRVRLLALLARAKHCDGMRPRPSSVVLVACWLAGSTVGAKNALCSRRFRFTVRPRTSGILVFFFFFLSLAPLFLRRLCDFDALAVLLSVLCFCVDYFLFSTFLLCAFVDFRILRVAR